MPESQINENAWHLDRKVPLGLIAVAFLQTGAAFWWASGMEARQAAAEAANARQDAEINQQQRDTQQIQITGGRVDATLQAFRESLSEVKEAQIETNTLLREILQNGAKKP